jgi:hypothetical protein
MTQNETQSMLKQARTSLKGYNPQKEIINTLIYIQQRNLFKNNFR